MKVIFTLEDAPFGIDLQIADNIGSRSYTIAMASEEGSEVPRVLEAEVSGPDFELTLEPLFEMPKPEEFPSKNWLEKVGLKAVETLVSEMFKIFLRVGCRYRFTGVQDGATIALKLRFHIASAFGSELLDLLPVFYLFAEPTLCAGMEYTGFRVLNRDPYISLTRKFALLDFGLQLIFTYPFQVSRAKRLTKDKNVRKTMQKLFAMTPGERENYLEDRMKRMEKWSDLGLF